MWVLFEKKKYGKEKKNNIRNKTILCMHLVMWNSGHTHKLIHYVFHTYTRTKYGGYANDDITRKRWHYYSMCDSKVVCSSKWYTCCCCSPVLLAITSKSGKKYILLCECLSVSQFTGEDKWQKAATRTATNIK